MIRITMMIVFLFRHLDSTALKWRRQWNFLLVAWSITQKIQKAYRNDVACEWIWVIKFDIVILEPWSAHQFSKEKSGNRDFFFGWIPRVYVELWFIRKFSFNLLLNIHMDLLQFQHFKKSVKPVYFDIEIIRILLPVLLLLLLLLLFIVQQ